MKDEIQNEPEMLPLEPNELGLKAVSKKFVERKILFEQEKYL